MDNKFTLSNGMDFMLVPAGSFLMGSEKQGSEKPQHIVDIPYDYWMARFPVTNSQYNVQVKTKRISHPVSEWETKSNHPVVNVNWNAALEYCQEMNNSYKTELPSDLTLRLPAESEWEKAARGPSTSSGYGREYPWGNQFDKSKCNSSEGGKGGTTSVGLYSPKGDSPYGCADMAGNVWEWTCSLYKPYPFNMKNMTEKAANTDWISLRGGSWHYGQLNARISDRHFDRPSPDWSYTGFRLLLAPPINLL